MLKLAIAALVFVLPLSVARADDRSVFNEYVETCVAENGTTDSKMAACIDEKIGAKEAYLDDLIGEHEAVMDADLAASYRTAQAAWEGYRDATCAYHAAVKPRDAQPRELLCRLRLVNARISEVLDGESFADFED